MDCVAKSQREARPQLTSLGGRATQQGRPVVTIAIIVICVAVWIGELLSDRFFSEVAFAPFIGEREPWRLVTSAFAHSPGSPLHIMFNMFALWLVGSRLELALGPARYIGLYLASALAGGVTWLLFQPVDSFASVVGASGAVFGLFGALFVVERHLGRDTSGILGIVLINGVIGFLVPSIAWQAHLGGLVAGGLVAFALVQARRRRSPIIAWLGIGGMLALCAVLFVAKYALGDPTPVYG